MSKFAEWRIFLVWHKKFDTKRKFVKTCRELDNSQENTSPASDNPFGGFGAGSSSSKFDFFNSAGGMFGGTGSTQEETGNGSNGKYNEIKKNNRVSNKIEVSKIHMTACICPYKF